MKNKMMIVAVAGLVAPALAQSNGDIVFTDNLNKRLGVIDGGGVSTLYNFGATDRPAQIERKSGSWYVTEGDNFSNTGNIYRFTHLFSSPNVSTFASGAPLNNPIGIEWDRATSQFITVNNGDNPPTEGIVGTNLGAFSSMLYTQNNAASRARYRDGADLSKDWRFGGYLVTSGNGGSGTVLPAPDGEPSSIWRFNPVSNSMSLVADLSSTPFGAIHQVRGVLMVPGGDVVFTDQGTDSIYRMSLDGSGAMSSLSVLASGLSGPHRVEWNQYTNMLVFSEIDGDKISEIALDGTGYNVLGTGMDARGLYIVPSPGALGALGMAGLALARRRR